MTLWSLTILYTASALLFIVLGGVQLHQPLTARGDVNTIRQTQALTFTHIQWECFGSTVGLWPDWLLTAAPARFSTKTVKRWNKWDVFFCKKKNSFSLLCMHTLQWNTQCSYNLTLAEHRGCCQNLFSSSIPSPCAVLSTASERATLNNIGSVSWHTVTYCNYLCHANGYYTWNRFLFVVIQHVFTR